MKLRSSIFLIVCLSFFTSCEDLTDIAFPANTPVLVIEGIITDQDHLNTVRLSTTTDVNDIVHSKPVSNASVKLSNGAGDEEVLSHTENGFYRIEEIIGEIGETYTLEVSYQGQEYLATSTMLPVSDIDTITYRFKENSLIDYEGYYISFSAPKSRKDQVNYYRWLLYKNDTLLSGKADIFVSTDEFISSLKDLELDVPFQKNDTVTLEMYSLDKSAYDYYLTLSTLITSDGGFFSPVPQNPTSNISNGALGIFSASAVSSRKIVIE
ncbi:DUF4249 domain-containing protein [Fulvivirgaceae bacterium BMA10]|uniref:DUF4249 domain-containing protein n=1 Tax=Splendidivirga corallicola TaxID=3051826 RepID=A0ABT8KSU5_9BACT|nr:DUF4249 domain-containing protein [Fulvivirgaceae bacterium BMA10]